MKNFWEDLARPFWILAPMEDVTDTVFRRIIANCGAPDVFFSEFVNVKGLKYEMENPEIGQIVSHRLLKLGEKELHQKPIVAQIWGITPEDYRQSAAKIVELGFDGIDINMGCPVRNVINQGACSALIKNHALAAEIIKAVQEGSKGFVPISVKTRIGFGQIDTENWATFLLSQNLQALTIHGRTVREESKVPCHWDEIGKVVAINNQMEIEKKYGKPENSKTEISKTEISKSKIANKSSELLPESEVKNRTNKGILRKFESGNKFEMENNFEKKFGADFENQLESKFESELEIKAENSFTTSLDFGINLGNQAKNNFQKQKNLENKLTEKSKKITKLEKELLEKFRNKTEFKTKNRNKLELGNGKIKSEENTQTQQINQAILTWQIAHLSEFLAEFLE